MVMSVEEQDAGYQTAPGHLPQELFQACRTGKINWERPQKHKSDHVTGLAWKRLGIFPEELEEAFRQITADIISIMYQMIS